MRVSNWARTIVGPLVLTTLSLGLMSDFPPPEEMQVGVRYGNQVLVPSNQLLNPAGSRVEFAGRPVDMALSPRGDLFAVLLPNTIQIYSFMGRSLRTLRVQSASFLGVAFTPDGAWVVASQVPGNGNHSVAIADVNAEFGVAYMSVPRNSVPAGLAFDRTGANLYVALSRNNAVGRLDISQGQVVDTVAVGVAPLGVAITPQGDRLFVTNWGGRRAKLGEATAVSSGTPALVDERGVASSGTVSVIDVASFQVIAEVPVGLHPSGIHISPDGRLAAVANANSDSVSLLDTTSLRVLETVNLPAFPQGYKGSSPTALAFSPSGQWLYVACGGNNAVAVLEREEGTYRLRGFAATDWYPIAVAVYTSPEGGETVLVANSKGIGSRNSVGNFNVHQALGTVNMFPGGTVDEAWMQTVSFANEPFRNAVPPASAPESLGQLGIRHVFLIIKENRTYDQVLGDLGRGNGAPHLAIYGWPVTPNQHELANQFVTLDNFYTSGVKSVDGHQWMTQALVTDYIERAHAAYSRGYPFWGDDPLAFAPTGFLWNNVQNAGLTVRVFGEFAVPASSSYSRNWIEFFRDAQLPQMRIAVYSASPVAALSAVIESSYPAYAMNIPDVYRARVFLQKFREFEQKGNLPNLIVLLLPADHTAGRTPNFPTPAAMVADNDLALGQIVEAITKSAFWPRAAIFVTEDDAQDGVDHVDGHRTLCFVLSPYVRRGALDSTHYNQTSILRTIEELLGLPPMNKFDASALPMRSVFGSRPDLRPFQAVPNRIALDQLNPSVVGLRGPERRAALDSMAMDFSRPDAAPEEILNRILWHTARGWHSPYPRVPHQSNCPREAE